jgi:hypothetical protein
VETRPPSFDPSLNYPRSRVIPSGTMYKPLRALYNQYHRNRLVTREVDIAVQAGGILEAPLNQEQRHG